ncbi:MAG: sigma-70 family RNA polymerase sigma factor [Clostridia bacterium]|nr:sigma-70 family RNA polymerase sigma factor [Clostridia bacterium]
MMRSIGEYSILDSEEQKKQQLEYLMRRFGDKVLKLAYYYLRDYHQAEDIAQEVFCRVYKNLENFNHRSSYFTWIYRITINLCKDYMKSAFFRRIVPWRDISQFKVKDDQTSRLMEAVEGGEIFQKVMDLPIKYRSVIVLRYFEGLSDKDISDILQISESAVRTRIHRAKKMLKSILSREEELYG